MKTQDKPHIYLLFWFLSNIIFFISLFTDYAIIGILGVILVELIVLYSIDKWSVKTLYADISAAFNLLRIGLFAYTVDNYEILLFISVFEFLFLSLILSRKYFSYFITSMPVLNFKNFGKLSATKDFNDKVNAYNFNIIRLVSYLAIIFFWHENYTNFLVSLFFVFLFFSLKLVVESAYYLKYLTSKQYSSDLKLHTNHHNPQVIVYVSGAKDSSYQLSQWIPVLEKLQLRVAVITRERFWSKDLPDSPLHTVYAKNMNDIDNFIGESTRICLYPVNSMKNTHMMRNVKLKHVFINHGESDKVVNQSRLLNAYDKLYLAGEMAKDRMVDAGFDMPKKKYTCVGRPQTSILLEDKVVASNFILYAPTWEGFTESANYCSVGKMGLALIKDIINNTQYNVIFKPHPLTGSVDYSLKKSIEDIAHLITSNNRGSFLRSGDILETMNRSDILITDISSVVNDFLSTARPYFVTNPNNVNNESYISEYKSLSASYIVNENSIENLSSTINALADTDTKKEDRVALKKYSLGDFDMTSFEKFEFELNNDYASM